MMNRDDIFDKVRDVLVDALGVDADEVTQEAVLTSDLGAESIDFLDISFKLEQAFRFKIAQGELFPDNAAQNPDYVQNGKLTAKGLMELREKMPHIDFTKFEADPQLSRIGRLFTVGALVTFVEGKLEQTASA
jgi:acyl carrier protein